MFAIVKVIGEELTSKEKRPFCIVEDMRFGVLDNRNTHYIEFNDKNMITLLSSIKEGDLVDVKFLERAKETEEGKYLNSKTATSIKKIKDDSKRSLYAH